MSRRTHITLLALGHACVDVYQGSVAALIPYFVVERAYTYAAASTLVLAASLASSVVQPIFGALADRWSMPWVLPVSTVVGGTGIAVSGIVHDEVFTLVSIAITGVGVAAYHPESARTARKVSQGSHTGMAWFSTGGNIGFALAPLLVVSTVGGGGLDRAPLLILPALVGAALTLPVLTAIRRTSGPRPTPTAPVEDDVRSFMLMTLAVTTRSIAFVGLSTFIALFAQQRTGGGAAAGTLALFVLYCGGVVGSLLGGSLAGHWGRVVTARRAYLLAAAAIAGVIWVPAPAMHVFIALASIGLYVPFSLQVTLGQDYLASRVGTASGVTLGLTVSVGGVVSPFLGRLADVSSLQAALMPLVLMPLLSWAFFCRLRDPGTGIVSPSVARQG